MTGKSLTGQSVFKLHVTAEDDEGNEVKNIPSIRIWYKSKPKAAAAGGSKSAAAGPTAGTAASEGKDKQAEVDAT